MLNSTHAILTREYKIFTFLKETTMLFLCKFLLLTFVYLAIFIFVAALVRWLWRRFVERPSERSARRGSRSHLWARRLIAGVRIRFARQSTREAAARPVEQTGPTCLQPMALVKPQQGQLMQRGPVYHWESRAGSAYTHKRAAYAPTNEPVFEPSRWSSFWKSVLDELIALGPDVDGGTNANNNRRWKYLAIMTALTFFIALANPGAPLLTSGLGHLFTDVLSDSAQQTANSFWSHFAYGNFPPAEKVVASPSSEPSWFWWQALGLYSFMTFFYFFFAYADEFRAGVKGMIETFRQHHARHEQRAQEERQQTTAAAAGTPQGQAGNTGQQPTPAHEPHHSWWQGIGMVAIVDLAMEMLYRFIREFADTRKQRVGGVV